MISPSSSAADMNAIFLSVIKIHALKAQASEYDRSVAVNAIASARACVEEILIEGPAGAYGQNVMIGLGTLYENYNDPDGQFTNGRGVLGSLIGDLQGVITSAVTDHV